MEYKTVIAKIDAGVPNGRMSRVIIPPPNIDDSGRRLNEHVWPRFKEGPGKGKLIHGGWLIVKDEKYHIPADYNLNQTIEVKDGNGRIVKVPTGLGEIFEEIKEAKSKKEN